MLCHYVPLHFVVCYYRVNSGAMIKIAGNEGDGTDRLVTITGTPESVGIAQYLINSRYSLITVCDCVTVYVTMCCVNWIFNSTITVD